MTPFVTPGSSPRRQSPFVAPTPTGIALRRNMHPVSGATLRLFGSDPDVIRDELGHDGVAQLERFVCDGVVPKRPDDVAILVGQCIRCKELHLLPTIWSARLPSRITLRDIHVTSEVVAQLAETVAATPSWKFEALEIVRCTLAAGAVDALTGWLNSFSRWADDTSTAIEFRMSGCGFEVEADLELAIRGLEKNASIRKLVLEDLAGIKSWLGDVLKVNRSILELELRNCRFESHDDSISLCQAMGAGCLVSVVLTAVGHFDARKLPEGSRALGKLIVTDCALGDDGLDAIAGLVSGSPQLEQLCLNGNSISTLPMSFTMVVAGSPSLRVLDLARNQLDGGAIQGLLKELRKNQTLHVLNLSSNPLGVDGAQGLGALLRENGSLTRLFIEDAGIDSEACEKVFEGLDHGRSGLHLLSLGRNAQLGFVPPLRSGRSASLEVLNLDRTTIAPEAIVMLLCHRSPLVELSLRSCGLSDVAVAMFAGTEGFAGLERLDLSGNPVGDACLYVILETCAMSGLKCLDVSHTAIGKDGLWRIACALGGDDLPIRELTLTQDWLAADDEFVERLAREVLKMLSRNRSLVRLDHRNWTDSDLEVFDEIDACLVRNQALPPGWRMDGADERLVTTSDDESDVGEGGGAGLEAEESAYQGVLDESSTDSAEDSSDDHLRPRSDVSSEEWSEGMLQ